jgi:predicted metal-dependent HD superfamily phosphohydrolase
MLTTNKEIRERWLWFARFWDKDFAVNVWPVIYNLYQSPSIRRYHTLGNHIIPMLEWVDKIKDGRGGEFASGSWNELEFAIWFHDIFCDPLNKYNEKESAWLASNLAEHNTDLRHKQVSLLIEATSPIYMFAFPQDFDFETKLLLDLDLSHFLLDVDGLARNENRLRLEYPFASDREFLEGRNEFLKNLLERDFFFLTEEFDERSDEARLNVEKIINRNAQIGGL